ncbi:MAG: hypothetical protein ACRC10_01955 [Thermoguttaceae bacterium]
MSRYFLLLLFSLVSTSWAGIQFPYLAEILENETSVFSEPADEGYETLQLQRGECVEVHQVRPDGWCAIRPPIGSFSWVSGSYLNVGQSNIGIVTVDKLASRIGSQKGDICRTVQVQLKKGERLVLLEKVETPENTSSPIWYKIVPPSGEFRWIRQESLSDPVPPKMPLSQGSPFYEGQGTNLSEQGRANLSERERGNPNEGQRTKGAAQQTRMKSASQSVAQSVARPVPQPTPLRQPTRQIQPVGVQQVAFQQAYEQGYEGYEQANEGVVPPDYPLSDVEMNFYVTSQTAVQAPNNIQDRYQRALAQLNLEVQTVMNRPIDDRTFEILIQKGESLVGTAPSELDRTRASQLVSVLQKTRSVRQRNALRRQRPDQPFSGPQISGPQTFASQSSPNPNSVQKSPFKASGRLGWFSQRPEGYPPFAVVNEQNQIVALITPEAGVDLQSYVDKQIAVDGKSGVYVNGNERIPHVSATGVYPLQ